MLSIGRFSRLCRISVKALRHYAELGLLKPARIDPSTGYRYYSLEQAGTAERIRLLRGLDMPLDEIRDILEERDERAAHERMLAHVDRLEGRVRDHGEMLAALKLLITGREGEGRSYELRHVVSQWVASLTAEAPYADRGRVVARLLPKIYAVLGDRGVAPCGPPTSTFEDIDEEDDRLRIRVAVPLAEGLDLPDLECLALAGGIMAATTHEGGYQGLPMAQQRLVAWMLEQRHEPGGPLREVYEVGPASAFDSSRYRTVLLIPVVPRGAS